MDKNSENTQEEQQINERIWVLEKKCKQLEEINAQYCDEDEQRLKQIDATEEENKALKKDNAFKAKQIQQEREENLQLKESLAEEQKKAEEMLLRNAVRIGSKASRMKPPSGASTPSSSSRSSSSTAGVNLQIHSVVTGASSFGKHKFTREFSSLPFTSLQNSETNSIVSFGSSKNLVSSMFNSSQQLDDEGCQSLEDQLGALNDGEQQFSSNGELTEKDSAVFVSADANDMEGRDSGNFSDQDQQDTVDNTMSEEVLPYVPGEGRPAGMTLAEELKLAEQQQKLKEELEKAQLEQHQQQNNVEEPELAVQHQQQNIVDEPELVEQHQQQNNVEEPELAVQHQQQNIVDEPELVEQHQQQNIVEEPELAEQYQQQNNSHTPCGARPRLHFLLLLLILLLFVLVLAVFVLVVVLPSVLRGELVMQIPVFFASWLRKHMLRGTNVVVHTEVMWHSDGLFGGGHY